MSEPNGQVGLGDAAARSILVLLRAAYGAGLPQVPSHVCDASPACLQRVERVPGHLFSETFMWLDDFGNTLCTLNASPWN